MPRSAARVMTLGSEVIMQPKPRVVRLRPVLPRVRWSSLAGELVGLPRALSVACSKPVFEAAAATGSINPADRNSRRDDFSVMVAPFPGKECSIHLRGGREIGSRSQLMVRWE